MTQQQAARAQQDMATARAALVAADAEQVGGSSGGPYNRVLECSCIQAPPAPELLPDFDVDEAMYFTDPQQLVDMFAQLEASNMFMLQAKLSSQDEAAVVHARYAQGTACVGTTPVRFHRCAAAQAAANAQITAIQQQEHALRATLKQEQQRLCQLEA